MPLPSISDYNALQCTAKAKSTKQRCLNPAAFGCKTCRLHGARHLSTIKRGEYHPNYQRGMETLEMKQKRSLKLAELKTIEADLLERGLIAKVSVK